MPLKQVPEFLEISSLVSCTGTAVPSSTPRRWYSFWSKFLTVLVPGQHFQQVLNKCLLTGFNLWSGGPWLQVVTAAACPCVASSVWFWGLGLRLSHSTWSCLVSSLRITVALCTLLGLHGLTKTLCAQAQVLQRRDSTDKGGRPGQGSWEGRVWAKVSGWHTRELSQGTPTLWNSQLHLDLLYQGGQFVGVSGKPSKETNF